MSNLQSGINNFTDNVNQFYSKLVRLYLNLPTNEKIAWIAIIIGSLLILISLISFIL